MDIPIFIAVILGAVLVLAGLVFAVNRDLLLQRNGTASIIILGGVFVTALQTVLVFNQLSLDLLRSEDLKKAVTALPNAVPIFPEPFCLGWHIYTTKLSRQICYSNSVLTKWAFL